MFVISKKKTRIFQIFNSVKYYSKWLGTMDLFLLYFQFATFITYNTLNKLNYVMYTLTMQYLTYTHIHTL